MAENEKQLLDDLAALPEPIKMDFMRQITGAATAVRVMTAEVMGSGKEVKDSG